MNPARNKVFTRPGYFFAYGFGSGLAPLAPGTAGSLLGLVIFLPMLCLPVWLQLGVIAGAFLSGVILTGRVAAELGEKDPRGIVWDEFVGVWITLLWLPSLWWLLIAFPLFRLFDICKPWPIGALDRKVHGGLGIMLDDVVAGLYALIVVQCLNLP